MAATEDTLRSQLGASDLDELTLLATRLHGDACTPSQAVNRLLNFAAKGIDAAEAFANGIEPEGKR